MTYIVGDLLNKAPLYFRTSWRYNSKYCIIIIIIIITEWKLQLPSHIKGQTKKNVFAFCYLKIRVLTFYPTFFYL